MHFDASTPARHTHIPAILTASQARCTCICPTFLHSGVSLGRFCSLSQFELSLRVAVGSCRCTFGVGLLGYGRPPDLDAKESGGSGGSFVAVREPPRRHGRINRSVCINVSVACIPCCILSCGGMCKEARTHDRRVWAGWLRACQLAHFRCARGP